MKLGNIAIVLAAAWLQASHATRTSHRMRGEPTFKFGSMAVKLQRAAVENFMHAHSDTKDFEEARVNAEQEKPVSHATITNHRRHTESAFKYGSMPVNLENAAVQSFLRARLAKDDKELAFEKERANTAEDQIAELASRLDLEERRTTGLEAQVNILKNNLTHTVVKLQAQEENDINFAVDKLQARVNVLEHNVVAPRAQHVKKSETEPHITTVVHAKTRSFGSQSNTKPSAAEAPEANQEELKHVARPLDAAIAGADTEMKTVRTIPTRSFAAHATSNDNQVDGTRSSLSDTLSAARQADKMLKAGADLAPSGHATVTGAEEEQDNEEPLVVAEIFPMDQDGNEVGPAEIIPLDKDGRVVGPEDHHGRVVEVEPSSQQVEASSQQLGYDTNQPSVPPLVNRRSPEQETPSEKQEMDQQMAELEKQRQRIEHLKKGQQEIAKEAAAYASEAGKQPMTHGKASKNEVEVAAETNNVARGASEDDANDMEEIQDMVNKLSPLMSQGSGEQETSQQIEKLEKQQVEMARQSAALKKQQIAIARDADAYASEPEKPHNKDVEMSKQDHKKYDAEINNVAQGLLGHSEDDDTDSQETQDEEELNKMSNEGLVADSDSEEQPAVEDITELNKMSNDQLIKVETDTPDIVQTLKDDNIQLQHADEAVKVLKDNNVVKEAQSAQKENEGVDEDNLDGETEEYTPKIDDQDAEQQPQDAAKGLVAAVAKEDNLAQEAQAAAKEDEEVDEEELARMSKAGVDVANDLEDELDKVDQ